MKRITVDRDVRDRGFRERVVADVQQTVYCDGVTYYVARVVSVFAYHPCAPELGRDLPVRGGLEAFTGGEITSEEELP